MLETTLGLFFGISAVWLWASNMRFREQALSACHAACRDQQVQLLDQTVVLRGWRLCKLPAAGLTVQRTYAFEYSGDGVERCMGRAIFTAGRCDYVYFASPTGATIWHRQPVGERGCCMAGSDSHYLNSGYHSQRHARSRLR